MKALKLFPLALLSLLFLFSACSKDSHKDEKKVVVPDAVKKAFNDKFPDAKAIEWGKEDEDFEADFTNKKIEMTVVLTKEGTILVTETAINKADLPTNITAAISEKYAGSTIEKAEKLVKNEGTFYEVELQMADKEIEVIFDDEGHVVEEEQDDDQEEHEDDND